MSTRMHIAFTLSMPSYNAWNGKWSDESKYFVRVLSIKESKKAREKYQALIGNHRHSFGDGWVAAIEVKEVTGEEKRKLVRNSQGFCGYDWMIESLRQHGDIRV